MKKNLYDGFEGDKLKDFWDLRKLEEGSFKLQSRIARKGKKSVKITIKKGDRIEKCKNCKTSERDELVERKELGPEEGKSYEYSFSVYIPKNFPIVHTRLVIAQWKQNEMDDKVNVDNPIIALRYVDDVLRITLQTSKEKVNLFKKRGDIRGKWIDFKFHLKFTRKKSGFVKAWMNRKKIIDFKGVTAYSEKYGYSKPGYFYFKMGLYRDRMDKPMTIYFDEYKKRELK